MKDHTRFAPELSQYKILDRGSYRTRIAASALLGSMSAVSLGILNARFNHDPVQGSSVAATSITIHELQKKPIGAEVTGAIALTGSLQDSTAIEAVRGRFLSGGVVNYSDPAGFRIDFIECSSTDGHHYDDKVAGATFECSITYQKVA